MNNLINKKFKDPKVTADGSDRAFVEAEKIKTLLFAKLFEVTPSKTARMSKAYEEARLI